VSDVDLPVGEFKLLGLVVGKRCLITLMGVGKHRLKRAVAGVPDLRFAGHVGTCVPRGCPKQGHVNAFFAMQYTNAAETFPTGSGNQVLKQQCAISPIVLSACVCLHLGSCV
jgi:hypothetical protein